MAEYRPRIWWRVPRTAGVNDAVKFRVKDGGGTEYPSASTWYTATVAGDVNAYQWSHVERLLYCIVAAINASKSGVAAYSLTDAGLATLSCQSTYQVKFDASDAPTLYLLQTNLGMDSGAIASYAASHTAIGVHTNGFYCTGGTVVSADDSIDSEGFEVVTYAGAPTTRAGGLAYHKSVAYELLTASEYAAAQLLFTDARALDLFVVETSGILNIPSAANYRMAADSIKQFAGKRYSPGLARYALELKLVKL